jgi:hypothetical protein
LTWRGASRPMWRAPVVIAVGKGLTFSTNIHTVRGSD